MNIKELFLELISFFDRNNIDYFITRNYEDYPEKFTGDIDIYVDLKKIYSNIDTYQKIITDGNWQFFKIIKRPWVLVFQIITTDISIDRPIMVIEHFNKFNWLFFEHTKFKNILNFKINYKGISVLPKDLGYLLAFNHYFYWAGFIPQKYKQHFIEAVMALKSRPFVKEAFPYGLYKKIDYEIQKIKKLKNDDWKKVKNIPELIYSFQRKTIRKAKFFLVLRHFLHNPFSTIFNLINLFLIKISDFLKPEGWIFYYSGTNNMKGKDLLYTLKKYHLYKNRSSRVLTINKSKSISNFFLLWDIYHTVANGGACIVYDKKNKFNKIQFFKSIFKNRITCLDGKENLNLKDISSILPLLKFGD